MHVLEIVSLMFREQVHVTLISFLCTQLKAFRTLVIKLIILCNLNQENFEFSLLYHVSLETVKFLNLGLEDICLEITRYQTIIPWRYFEQSVQKVIYICFTSTIHCCYCRLRICWQLLELVGPWQRKRRMRGESTKHHFMSVFLIYIQILV